ncbi:MAG TPA: histidine kinase [Protaetiibacter sp.]|nr:histidine kinase [Protaetiibacter sp.]
MTTAPPPPGAWSTPGPTVSRTPRRRHPGRAATVWAVVLSILLAISTAGTHAGDDSVLPHALQLYIRLGALVMIGVSVMLVWRHRWPVWISLGAILFTLLIPTTPLPMLIALAASVAAVDGRRRWALIGGSYLATIVTFVWDLSAPTSYLAMWVDKPAVGTPERWALLWAVPVIAAMVVLPFAAVGIVRHLRAERDAAQQETVAAERNVQALHREVDLERHRQELARELHDTLAARLSTLSLHVGALELSVDPRDERAVAAARVVRESAQHSLDDLRGVVRELRNPTMPEAATMGLGELSALVDEALRVGTDVRAQVLVSDPGSCDPRVAHAVYRLVQESISNARQHAPGSPLHVDVRGGPGAGLSIRATNWMAAPAHASSSGGNGLVGMAERAELLGGTFRAGPTPDGAFGVVAWLPWVPLADPGEGDSAAPLV